MRNVEVKVEGSKLTVVMDLAVKGERSASGKTLVVSTTEGNQPVPGTDPQMFLGLNLYHK